jgi:hypothetical protein
MVLCCNCEFASATLSCTVCSPGEKKDFCGRCSDLHLGVMMHSNHSFSVIIQESNLCSNCEYSTAKFSCLDCPLTEQNFCLACSITHPKIKATRNHRVYRSNCEEDESISLSLIQKFKPSIRMVLAMTPIAEFVEVLHFFDSPVRKFQLSTQVIFCAVASVGLLLLLRRTIGHSGSSALTIFGTLCLLWYVQKRQKSITVKSL